MRRIAVGLILLAGAAFPLGDASAEDAHQCLTRQTDTTGTDIAGDKAVSAYVSVPETSSVSVSAAGWGDGSEAEATFGVEILKDNVVIAQSDEQIGDGMLSAGVSAHLVLEPGAQTKISAKPYGRDKSFHFVRMSVAVGGDCS